MSAYLYYKQFMDDRDLYPISFELSDQEDDIENENVIENILEHHISMQSLGLSNADFM